MKLAPWAATLAARRDITLRAPEFGPPPDPGPCVLADRQRLKQVLLNLLSNAVKYCAGARSPSR